MGNELGGEAIRGTCMTLLSAESVMSRRANVSTEEDAAVISRGRHEFDQDFCVKIYDVAILYSFVIIN